MDVLKSIAVTLTSPLIFALALLLSGWLLNIAAKYKLARFCRVTALIWLAVFSQPYVSNLLLYPLEYSRAPQNNAPPPKYIHVLACYYNTLGNMSEVSRWSNCSIERNIEAFRQYIASQQRAKIIVTGGNFLANKDVFYANKAADFFVSLGVPLGDILTLPSGTNTQEEAQEVLRIYDNGPLLVVSSATHIKRLTMIYAPITQNVSFQAVDYHSDGRLTPHLTLPKLWALTNAQHAFYEYLALAKFHLTS
ncbi:YdcF family protein [Alteromonas sp. 345S023]|uniref:YdcF family protein n=1 Tax=Alteromonas profundi TaxID=2696062 RepID=A0A7X5LLB7_9ALTE|nr:ElyC/SanA/YdcF family protein [Alteromonas profundi]NDV91419.1 YdcF family protein [Alteromonas profundi]